MFGSWGNEILSTQQIASESDDKSVAVVAADIVLARLLPSGLACFHRIWPYMATEISVDESEFEEG